MADVRDTLDELALLIARAEHSVTNRTFDELVANDEVYDALTCRPAMIGQNKKLSDEIKARHAHLPWREMATFRNFASHDYFGVAANLVWQAARSLGPVKAMMLDEIARIE